MRLNAYLNAQIGRCNRLAESLNVPGALVSQWSGEVRPVPAARCPSIELATNGAVTCEEIRGDIAWFRVRDRKWPHPKGRPLVDYCAAKAA